MQQIKNIILDFGKVLVDYDSIQLIRRITPDRDRQEFLIRIIEDPAFVDRVDKGEQSLEEILRELSLEYPDYAPEFAEYDRRYGEEVTGEIPGMRELLKKLKLQGYHLFGLSNWCSRAREVMREYHELFSMLEGYVLSSDIVINKPDAEIFRYLLGKYGLDAKECVFVDDKAKNVEAARKLGMQGIVFTDARQLESYFFSSAIAAL